MNDHHEALNTLISAITGLQSEEECTNFLKDLCTAQELDEMAQRLQVAMLLSRGETYETVRRQLGVSNTTITRVSSSLSYGSDGYRKIIERLGKGKQD